ncbi:MAG: peptidase, partial [Flavobacteriaceae bacterium]
MKKIILLVLVVSFYNCKKETTKQDQNDSLKVEAQAFLDEYSKTYKDLYYASALAEWDANTKIIAGDTLNAYNVQKANEAFAKFTGSSETIEKTKRFLENKDVLDIKQVRQL